MNAQNTRGFTLIELVVVIVILGILAATALPKFADMQTEARISTVKALAGAVTSTASTARALCALTPTTCDVNASHNSSPIPTTTLNGWTVWMHHGYPSPWNGPLNVWYVSYQGFTLQPYVVNSLQAVWTKDDAPTPASCRVAYNAPWSAGQTFSVSITTTGC